MSASPDKPQVVKAPSHVAESCSQVASAAVRRLRDAGFDAYLAGGCVRDLVMGNVPKDYDIATSAKPPEVEKLFPGSVAIGKAFGVERVPVEDMFFEIATFRRDHAYADGRRPVAVTFSDAATDALRRDFTINALFYDPATDTIIDYVGGLADIHGRLVRAVGDADQRLMEDHLRMLRAVRFTATLDFALDQQTAEAVKQHSGSLSTISAERVRDELTRIVLEPHRAGAAVALLNDLGLLSAWLPEVEAMAGQEQPPEFHPEGDVFAHTMAMLDLMKTNDHVLAYAVLLHDIGKPVTADDSGDRLRFHGHAARGAEIAHLVLKRIRFSSDDTDSICHAIRNHMNIMHVQHMRRSTLRRLIGAPTFDVELELHRLDCLSMGRTLANYDFLVAESERLRAEPVLPAPWVTGHDIMALGVPSGPEVGRWHRKAYDCQLEESCDSRDALLAWLREEIGQS